MAPEATSADRRLRWFVPAVLCLAAFLRLTQLDLVSVTNDEGSHARIAMHIVAAPVDEWPLAGLPSVGIRNSALFVYLIAIANLVYFHPLSGVVLVSLLNVAAVYLTWRMTRHHFGVIPALIATLLYASSPWSVLFARNMWPPSCLAVICLFYIDLALRWLNSGGRLRLAALCCLSFIIPQVHFSGAIAPLWLLCVLWTGRKRWKYGPMFAGALLGLATWTPWIVFQRVTNWNDLRTAGAVAEGKVGFGVTLQNTLMYLQQQLHSEGFEYWFGRTPRELPEFFSTPLRGLCDVWAAVLVGCFLGSVVIAFRNPEARPLRFLLLWCLLPVIGLLAVRPIVHPHYVLVAYPLPLISAAVFLGDLVQSRWSRARSLLVLLLVGISVTHLVYLFGWYQYVADGRTDGRGHFELSYRQRRAAVLSVLEDSPDFQVEIAGPFAGFNAAYDYIAVYERLRLGRLSLRPNPGRRYWIDVEPVDITDPAERARRETSMSNVLAEFQGTPPAWRIVKHWRVGPSRIYRLQLDRDR